MSHRIIHVKPVGNPDYPRYVLADNLDMFWNGEDWVSDENEAWIYADLVLVSNDSAVLQRQQTLSKEHVRMAVVTIRIEAFSDQPLDAEALREWLQQNVNMGINFSSGSGPTPDSIVLGSLEWQNYRDVKVENHK